MLIIVEGIDKSGKSTLIDYLSKNLNNAFVLKIGSRPKDSSEEERKKIIDMYFKALDFYRLVLQNDDTNPILIMDRFYISELVYAAKRGYDALDKTSMGDDMRLLKEVIEGLDAILIYCRVDEDTLKENFAKDKEDYVVPEEITDIVSRYNRYVETLKIPMLPYNYKNISLQAIKSVIQYKIQESRGRAK